MTSLLDVLKETDLRVDFTHSFTGTGTRTALDRASLNGACSCVSLAWGRTRGSSGLCHDARGCVS